MTANHRMLDNADILLIERVKQTAALYDSRHPEFRTYRKDQIWAQLASTLGMSTEFAKRRWTCLRDRYSRELKQMRKHPENDSYGRNEFFRQMDFLRKFVKVRRERRATSGDCDIKSESSRNIDKYECISKNAQIYENESNDLDSTNEQDADMYDSKSGYEVKDALCNNNSNFPEYVEVDADENYGDYVSETTAVNVDNKVAVVTADPPRALTARQSTPQPPNLQQHPECVQKHKNENAYQAGVEDDYFSKSIAAYLRQLSRRNKIKAKVEMFQILEKYIELEENNSMLERKS